MRLLILSLYYPPDLSAGSFRISALVKALQREMGQDLEIDLITSMPNRYSTHISAAEAEEITPGLRVRRIALPAHNSGMKDQAKSFAVFARKAMVMSRGESWDLVLATSSRLMTAVLGMWIARRSKTPLYLDIRDLFTDTMADLLTDRKARHLLPIFRGLERQCLRRAARVNLVSAGFLAHAQRIAPNQTFRTFTNGIDEEFLESDFSGSADVSNDLPLIFYGGNMGEGQGLHRIVPFAAARLQGKARFRLVGDGGRRAELETAVREANLDNVEILPPVSRAELHNEYRNADILFLHLNDHPAFHKVLPSKIFEYAATGKPMLAGVSGYAAQFLKQNVPGCSVFPPCDVDTMVDATLSFDGSRSQWNRTEFRQSFSRTNIMQAMAGDILSICR